jgi:hypothetical protein
MTMYAAIGGNLKILQWAHSNGCHVDERICNIAASSGHLAVLEWACQVGFSYFPDEEVEIDRNLHVLQWIHENGGLTASRIFIVTKMIRCLILMQ